jgi:hypothetical protein
MKIQWLQGGTLHLSTYDIQELPPQREAIVLAMHKIGVDGVDQENRVGAVVPAICIDR